MGHIVEKDWTTKAGLRAAVLIITDGKEGSERKRNRCGYVAVPAGHPIHRVGHRDPCPALREAWEKTKEGPIEKRGIFQLFFASDDKDPRPDCVFDVHGGLTYSSLEGGYPVAGEGDSWWFGFDCGHDGDGVIERGPYDSFMSCDGVKSLEYVEGECERLAEQFSGLVALTRRAQPPTTPTLSRRGPTIPDDLKIEYPHGAPLPKKPLSVSAQKNYEKCPYSYWANRANMPGGERPAAELGSAVHSACEAAGLYCIAEEIVQVPLENVAALVAVMQDSDGHKSLDEERQLDAVDMVERYCRTATFSPDLEISIEKEFVLKQDGTLSEDGWGGKDGNPDDLARGKIDLILYDPGLKHLLVEDLKSSGVKGRIDRINRKTHNKPGKVDADRRKWPKDTQLRYYLYAVMLMYPEAETIVLGHRYLRVHNEPETNALLPSRVITDSLSCKKVREFSNIILEEIRSWYREIAEACEIGRFPATESPLCGWCEYSPKVGSGICPFFQAEDIAVRKTLHPAEPRLVEDVVVVPVAEGLREDVAGLKPAAPPEPVASPEHVPGTANTQKKESPMTTTPPAKAKIQPVQRPAIVLRPPKRTSWGAVPPERPVHLLISGPSGTGKTRSVLHAFAKKTSGPPRLAMMDIEDGTKHYADEFSFIRSQDESGRVTTDTQEIVEIVEGAINNLPEGCDTLGIDSLTFWIESLEKMWTTRYKQRRKQNADGQFAEWYEFQVKDYKPMRLQQAELFAAIRDCPHNVVATAHTKAAYSKTSGKMMDRIGDRGDGGHKAEHWFDTVIQVIQDERDPSKLTAFTWKDRTNCFPDKKDGEWPWTETSIRDFLAKRKPAAAPKPAPKATVPLKTVDTPKVILDKEPLLPGVAGDTKTQSNKAAGAGETRKAEGDAAEKETPVLITTAQKHRLVALKAETDPERYEALRKECVPPGENIMELPAAKVQKLIDALDTSHLEDLEANDRRQAVKDFGLDGDDDPPF